MNLTAACQRAEGDVRRAVQAINSASQDFVAPWRHPQSAEATIAHFYVNVNPSWGPNALDNAAIATVT